MKPLQKVLGPWLLLATASIIPKRPGCDCQPFAVECEGWAFINPSGKVVKGPASGWSSGGETFW